MSSPYLIQSCTLKQLIGRFRRAILIKRSFPRVDPSVWTAQVDDENSWVLQSRYVTCPKIHRGFLRYLFKMQLKEGELGPSFNCLCGGGGHYSVVIKWHRQSLHWMWSRKDIIFRIADTGSYPRLKINEISMRFFLDISKLEISLTYDVVYLCVRNHLLSGCAPTKPSTHSRSYLFIKHYGNFRFRPFDVHFWNLKKNAYV